MKFLLFTLMAFFLVSCSDKGIRVFTPPKVSSLVCADTQAKVGETCVSKNQTRACSPQPTHSSSGEQSSTDAGVTWGACTNFSCDSGFVNYNGSCVSGSSRACLSQPANSSGGQEITIDNGVSYLACSGFTCDTNYMNVAGSCLLTNQSRACIIQPNHSTGGTENSTDGGQTFSSCVSYVCDASYTNVGGSCNLTNQTRACVSQPANSNGGTEATSDGGVTWGACSAYSCNGSYTNVAGVCSLTNQSRACSSQPANSTGGTESSTNGGVSFGSCTGYTCSASYTNVAGVCSLTNQSRACSSQPSNSTGGTESSTNGGVSFGSCSGFTCNSNYNLSGGACVANNAPVGVAASYLTGVSTVYNGTVSATDADGNTLTYAKVANPSHGTVTINSAGSFTYTPTAAYEGSDSFTFKANDGHTDSATTTITMQVGCPHGFIRVPGNLSLSVGDFCIMKAEAMENAYHDPYDPVDAALAQISVTSETSTHPYAWIEISSQKAKTQCRSLGANYDLPSNAEWMTVARNVENVGSNWSSGIVGTGRLAKGHTDDHPNQILGMTWGETDPYAGTTEAPFANDWDQRRTLTLDNGQVIWDFSGNAQEFVDWEPDGTANITKAPFSCDYNISREFHEVAACGNPLAADTFMPGNPANVTATSYNSTYNLGTFLGNSDPAFGVATRGGSVSEDSYSGIFAINLWWDETEIQTYASFRCVFRP